MTNLTPDAPVPARIWWLPDMARHPKPAEAAAALAKLTGPRKGA